MIRGLGALLSAGSVAVVALGYASSQGIARRRFQLIAAGLSGTVAIAGWLVSGALLFDIGNVLDMAAGTSIVAIAGALVAGRSKRILGLADRILELSLRASGMTLFIVALLVIFVVGLGGRPEPTQRTPLALALLGLAVGGLLAPLVAKGLGRLARAVTYGERPAPSEIPKDLGARLTRSVPADEMLLQAAEILSSGLDLKAVEIWQVRGEELVRTVSVPHMQTVEIASNKESLAVLARLGVTGRAWLEVWLPDLSRESDRNLRVVPATYAGEVLATIVAERDRNSDPFTPADDDVMTDVARQLGGLLHSHRLDKELQVTLQDLRRYSRELEASRARIVATADEERRRLERDLHDGAQQRLMALSVQLSVVREMLKSGTGDPEQLVGETSDQVREAILELRTLAHGIYPPILQSSGLEGALSEAAARAAIATDVELDGVTRYSREIEAAIYFCCLEALQNAAKHAGPGACAVIRVHDRGTRIIFEVSDDGGGFDASIAAHGKGFTNMSDRLGAIGGRLDVDSAPGEGTVVTGDVPIPRTSDREATHRDRHGPPSRSDPEGTGR